MLLSGRTKPHLPPDRTQPSTACKPCRKRRAKCDRKRPNCTQCIKTYRTCSGYREQLDLVLRDENTKVQRRIHQKGLEKPLKSLSMSSTEITLIESERGDELLKGRCPSESIDPSNDVNRSLPLVLAPKQETCEFAVNFFVSNFRNGVYLDYLPQLYGATDRSAMLDTSFAAVALLYLAERECRSDYMEKALQNYSTALRATNSALSTTTSAARDDTIASVMLLALFTAFSVDSVKTSNSWAKHINGALMLMHLRPADTFKGHVIKNILHHVASSVQVDCLQRKIPFPPHLRRLRRLSTMSADPFQIRFWHLLDGLARILPNFSEYGVNDPELVKQAHLLDIEAHKLLSALNNKIGSCEEIVQGSDGLFRQRAVLPWNTLRMIRMTLNEYIAPHGQYCLSSDNFDGHWTRESLTLRVDQASVIFSNAVRDVCDTVPIQLRSSDMCKGGRNDTNAWICSLVWPLDTAANSPLLSEDLRQRVLQQLKHFAEISDHPQISRVAHQAATYRSDQNRIHVLQFC